MKTILSLIVGLSFLSTFAHAAGTADSPIYQLKMEVSVGKKLVVSPTIKTTADEKAVVTQKNEDGSSYIIEVVASPVANQEKTLKVVFHISSEKNGETKELANTEIILKEKKDAGVTIGSNDGKPSVSVKVWAKKITKK